MIYVLDRKSIFSKVNKRSYFPQFVIILANLFPDIRVFLEHNYPSSVWHCFSLFFHPFAVQPIISRLFGNLYSSVLQRFWFRYEINPTVVFFYNIMENVYAWYLCVGLRSVMKTQTCHFFIHILKEITHVLHWYS